MSPLIHGAWRIAVSDDEETARYPIRDWLEWSEDGSLASVDATGQARAVIELRRHAGAMMPVALVGGKIGLTAGSGHLVRVGTSSEMTLGAARTCRTSLGSMLVPGLPHEFAQATMDGAVRVPADWMPGAVVEVDRAAYDEVDSSGSVFEWASGILVVALLARIGGSDLDNTALERLLDG